MQRVFIKKNEKASTAFPKKLMAIGFAGLINFTITYPFDVLKSIIQTCDNP